jgi:flavorubredoxin
LFISNDIRYIGVNDHQVTLFEGQYDVPLGMAYNSYVILDEKVAVMDTVDAHFGGEWMDNLTAALAGRTPDYLVVQHMEPDHSANIVRFMDAWPAATVVASQAAFRMMKQFYGSDYADRRLVVGEGDTLALGHHTLTFLTAPMVHWPEVIVTYDSTDKVLFSADGLGKFGALDVEDPEGWACEARRYYFGIVGKFGAQVQALLKKASAVDIQTVCPLHGPVLTGAELAEALRLYGIWSGYGVESEGVMITYASVYGNTEKAVELLAQKLKEKGCPKVAVTCVQRDDWAEAVEDAFRYGKLVLAAPTYNGFLFPAMREFIQHLTERNYQNRQVAFIENGSWAPAAAKEMKKLLEGCKNVTLGSTVTIRSAMTEENKAQLDALADELL